MKEDWVETTLGESCKFYNGKAHENQIDENGAFIVVNSKFISSDGLTIKKTNDALFPLYNNDIVMVMSDVPNGKAIAKCYLIEEDNKYSLNQRICAIRSKKFNTKFLYYHLNRHPYLLSFDNGENQTNLRKNDILRCPLYIPPLPEQKRIVAILDEAFEAIARSIANTEKNLANSREVFESYLNAIFTQKGDGWTEKTLIDVCVFQGGSQPPKSVFSVEKKEGYVRLIQIRDYKSDKYIIHIPKKDARRFCQPDDIMIGRYGPPLFQILRGLEGAYNVALMKAIPNEEIISKDFLFYFLKNNRILNYVINSSSRTAGQTGINKATIEPYPIAFPTLENQAIIVSQLQELKIETQRLEAIYRQKITALKELKQSILQKAFTGELTADTPKTVKEKIAA